MDKKFITRNEAAEIMSVSPTTISNYANNGLFKVLKTKYNILVEKESFDAFVASAGVVLSDANEGMLVVLGEIESKRKELDETNLLLSKRIEFYRARGTFLSIVHAGKFSSFVRAIAQESNMLNEWESEIVERVLKGASFSGVSDAMHLRRFNVERLFNKACFKMARWMSEQASLKEQLLDMHDRVHSLKAENERMRKQLALYGDNNKSRREIRLSNTSAYDWFSEHGASARLLNVLKTNGFSMYDVMKKNNRDFMRLRNFGRRTLAELLEILEKNNLSLSMNM